MKRKGQQQDFDAVQMMRKIRDQLDREITNMTFAEERAYLNKLIADGRRRKEEKGKRELVER